MSVPKAITLTTGGFGTKGFTFSVLSNQTGNTEAQRDQFEDPHYDKDYDNQPFVAGVVYRFLGYHPTYMPDEELVRVVFKESGGYEILDPSEDPTNSGSGSGNTGGNTGTNVTLTQLVTAAGATGQLATLLSLFQSVPSNPEIATLIGSIMCNMLDMAGCGNTGGGNGSGSSSIAAAYAGCVNMPINNDRIQLASAEDNKLITHQLGTSEFVAAFYRLVGGTYRLDPNVGVSNPTDTAFNLYSPEGSFTGLVKLTRADAL